MDNYQVFISFKNTDNGKETEDVKLASELFHALEKNGVKVFFSKESVMETGSGDYRRLIDKALDECVILVAVGTRADYLESKWVRYEYVTFHDDILSGVKDENKCTICSYAVGVPTAELPRPLRTMQSFNNLDGVVDFVLNHLRKTGVAAVSNSAGASTQEEETILTPPVDPPKKERKKKDKHAVSPDAKKPKKNTKKILVGVLCAIVALIVLIVGVNALNTVRIPVLVNGEKVVVKEKKSAYSLYLSDVELIEDSMTAMEKFKALGAIDLSNCTYSNDVINMLPTVAPELSEISILECNNNVDYSFINSFSLEELTIYKSNLNDESVSVFEPAAFKNAMSVAFGENPNLTDISFLKDSSLRNIDVSKTGVSDISALSTCADLVKVVADDSKVKNIDCLADLTELNTLSFANCNIKEIKAEFKSLKVNEINFSGNGMKSMTGLDNLTQLSNVDISGNKGIYGIDCIKKSASKLTYLDISDDRIYTDYSFLLDAKSLETLCVSNNYDISDEMFIPEDNSLKTIIASNCLITDVSDFAKCKKLEYLDLSHNNIKSLKGINMYLDESASNKLYLDVSFNNIEKLDVQPVNGYEKLFVYGNTKLIYSDLENYSGDEIYVSYSDQIKSATFAGFDHVYVCDVPEDKKIDLFNLTGQKTIDGAIVDGKFLVNAE